MNLSKNISISKGVQDYAQILIDEYNLTSYEALDIALKVEKNSLFKEAFVIISEDTPTALEKICNHLEDINISIKNNGSI